MPVQVFAVGLNMHSRSTLFTTDKWCSIFWIMCIYKNIFSLYTDYIVDVVDIVDLRDNIMSKYIVDIVDIYNTKLLQLKKTMCIIQKDTYIHIYIYIYRMPDRQKECQK